MARAYVSQDPALLRRLLRAKDRMDAASHEEWPVARLAQVSHVSQAHFARCFKQAFGLPPHRYLTGRRVEAARGRLLAGEAISEVAVAVGFHDQAHLHRHFAKLVGTTPARFAGQGARWRDDLPR